MTMADLREYSQFNKRLPRRGAQAKKAGRTADEIAKGWTMPAKYAGYAAPQAARAQANVEVVYNETK